MGNLQDLLSKSNQTAREGRATEPERTHVAKECLKQGFYELRDLAEAKDEDLLDLGFNFDAVFC